MKALPPNGKPERRCWWAVFGFPMALNGSTYPLSSPVFVSSPRGAVQQVLLAPTLHRRLYQPLRTPHHELQRLHNHSFAAPRRQVGPPINPGPFARRIGDIDRAELGGEEQLRVVGTDLCQGLHVPDVAPIGVDLPFGGEQMERSQLEVVERFDGPAVVAVRRDELPNGFVTSLRPGTDRTDSFARLSGEPSSGLTEGCHGSAERRRPGRADGGVLRPEQVLRLRRPRHQFTVQTGPGSSVLVPEAGCPKCRGQALKY